MWYQLDEVLSRNPQSVLEIGPGPGLFKASAGHFGVLVETVDIDSESKPDCVASAPELPSIIMRMIACVLFKCSSI